MMLNLVEVRTSAGFKVWFNPSYVVSILPDDCDTDRTVIRLVDKTRFQVDGKAEDFVQWLTHLSRAS